MKLSHPSERYYRLRVWLGQEPLETLKEMGQRLEIPGAGYFKETKNPVTGDVSHKYSPYRAFQAIMDTGRVRKDLRFEGEDDEINLDTKGIIATLRSQQRANAPSLPQDLAWLEERDIRSLSDKDYCKRFLLDEFYGSRARDTRMYNAMRLWTNVHTREVIRGMISSGGDDKEIQKNLVQLFPRFFSGGEIRVVDVKSARELFWDFDGMDRTSRVNFLHRYGATFKETLSSALADPRVYMFLHTGQAIDMSELERYKTVRDLAFVDIARMRVQPGEYDSNALRTSYQVMKDAEQKVKDLMALEIADADEMVRELQVREREDYQSLPEIMDETNRQADIDLINEVLSIKIITREEYDLLQRQLTSGALIPLDVRIKLRDARREHYEGMGELQGEYIFDFDDQIKEVQPVSSLDALSALDDENVSVHASSTDALIGPVSENLVGAQEKEIPVTKTRRRKSRKPKSLATQEDKETPLTLEELFDL